MVELGFNPDAYEVAEEGGFITVTVSVLSGGISLGSSSGVVLVINTDGNSTDLISNTTATGKHNDHNSYHTGFSPNNTKFCYDTYGTLF